MECGKILCTRMKGSDVEPRADDAANESEAGNAAIDKASANGNGKEIGGDSAAHESVAWRMSGITDAIVTQSVEKGGSCEFNSGVKIIMDLMID